MSKQTTVSVIMPAYNRAHLIAETLDSIIVQTYSQWECLVVDDGSTDSTTSIIAEYAQKDKRIKLFKRPDTKPKGANACRNIGLNKAQGNYVVFFDSDDLMTENHLEIKVNAIQKFNCDYVITKTQYFNHTNDGINRYYQFDTFPITANNYVTQKINWLTLDVCVKTSMAQSISFNENLQSGQEYNYFCKLVHKSTHAEFIGEIVSLRRHHETSIRSQLSTNNSKNKSFFKANWYTYLDLRFYADQQVLLYLMRQCTKLCYEMKSIPSSKKTLFLKEVFDVFGFKGFYFILMLVSRKLFNKGYTLRVWLVEN